MSAEAISVVTLKCANCAGLLEVNPYIDTLACGYCGSSQQVIRQGGAVSLSLLQQVSHSTGKAAAELAIRRLSGELYILECQRPQIEAEGIYRIGEVEQRFNKRGFAAFGAPVVFGVALFLLMTSFLALVVSLALGAGAAFVMTQIFKPQREQEESQIRNEIAQRLFQIDSRIQWTHAAIQHNTYIANS